MARESSPQTPPPFDLAKVGVRTAAAAAGSWVGADFAASRYPRAEVEEAYRDYVRRANANDWDAWCDIFTEDVLYVDHHFGVFRGREEVRKWMVPLMASQPEMKFPPGWYVIVGDLLVNYNWNRWPNPDGTGEPYDDFVTGAPLDKYRYQFPCVTINRYGGKGLFCYEEDFYSAPAYAETLRGWQEEKARGGGGR